MNEAILEDNQLARVRNVALDVVATLHLREAYKAQKSWDCHCGACQYMRTEPALVSSVWRTFIKRDFQKWLSDTKDTLLITKEKSPYRHGNYTLANDREFGLMFEEMLGSIGISCVGQFPLGYRDRHILKYYLYW